MKQRSRSRRRDGGLRRWGGRVVLGLAVLLMVGAAGLWLALRSSLPVVEGEIAVPGLDAPVTVTRDAHAVPHIEAASLLDATFAQGYVHAQDRLFQMEFQRRLAAGRLAEVLGARALGFDRYLRTLGLYRLALASVAHQEPATRAWLEAYAAGVNAYLATRRGLLPPEFLLLRHFEVEPWTPADSLVWLKMMALDLSSNWREEVLRLQLEDRLTPAQMADLWPDYPPDAPVTLALAPALRKRLAAALPFLPLPGFGSNAWVLAPERTATGGALLANDPHLGLQAPGTWYLVHLNAPDGSLTGASLPGVPGVVLGHNGKIAWGLTTTGSDVQDLFIEQLEGRPDLYLTPDGSPPFEQREEVIRVRGGPPVTLTVRSTRHGPVVSDLGRPGPEELEPDQVAALAWPALAADDTTLQGLFKVMQANDWEGFVAALRDVVAPQQNVFYADDAGRIGFYVPGRVPVRRSGKGLRPVPGWTGDFDWTGWIPFEQLPHAVDPPTGALVNANNKVVPDDYPHFLTAHWDATDRAERIDELIAGDGHDLERQAAIQADLRSGLASDLLPLMLAIRPEEPALRDVLERLGGWDRVMRADAPEPLIFTAWYRAFSELAWADELGPLFPSFGRERGRFVRRILTGRTVWCDDVRTPAIESCEAVLEAALEMAMGELEQRLGKDLDAWRWGDLHRAAMNHPIFGEVPVLDGVFNIDPATGGDGTTVNVGHPALHGAERYASRQAPSYRALYDLADLEASRFMIATGQSGHPLSPHYDDLSAIWAATGYLRLAAPGGQAVAGRLRLIPAPL